MDNWKEKVVNEVKLRGYSNRTLKLYLLRITDFLSSKLDERAYLLKLVNEGKSRSTVRTAGFAIKFYNGVLGKDNRTEIPNVKLAKSLPVVLSKREIESLVLATKNVVHRLIIEITYAAGLRVSEVISLNWNDIDFDRNIIHIKNAKGNKDRVVMLSPKIKKRLKLLGLDMQGYLFKTVRGAKYTARSIQAIVRNSAKKAGITKKATPHSLRHSFATHLLDRGTDIRYIKELLGHANISTTSIYTKVSNRDISRIKSPLD